MNIASLFYCFHPILERENYEKAIGNTLGALPQVCQVASFPRSPSTSIILVLALTQELNVPSTNHMGAQGLEGPT